VGGEFGFKTSLCFDYSEFATITYLLFSKCVIDQMKKYIPGTVLTERVLTASIHQSCTWALSSSSQATILTLWLYPSFECFSVLLPSSVETDHLSVPLTPKSFDTYPKFRSSFFQFHLFSHTSSFYLICIPDSSSLTQLAKMELLS